MEWVIHKLNISAEAVFDISDILGIREFDMRTLKSEVEEYIIRQAKVGCLPWWGYFRVDYIDEDSGRQLKLFISKAVRLGLMQYWELRGVCAAADWSEDLEDDGTIRCWLNSKVVDLPKGDWVLEQIIRTEADKLIGGGVQGTVKGLPRELTYAITHGNNQELAEAIRFLQGAGGKWARWRYVKREGEIPRDSDKPVGRQGLQADKGDIPRQAINRRTI
jgi:hypothetical protein